MVFLLAIVVLMLAVFRRREVIVYNDLDDEIITTTTTTTTTTVEPAEYVVEGDLVRSYDRKIGRYYVKDPVDGQKTYVNEGDDLYRDAGGNIYRLV